MSTLPRRITDLHAAQDDVGDWAETRRDRLMAVVGRVPLDLAKEQTVINACRGASCRQGRLPCRERCGAEMGGDAGDAPTVPTRRLPTKPRLSAWRRLLLWLTSWSASIRRT